MIPILIIPFILLELSYSSKYFLGRDVSRPCCEDHL